MITGKFPRLRLRRSRKNDWSRRLIEENNLTHNDFILPIFLIDGINKKQPIKTMPGVYRYTLDRLSKLIDKAIKEIRPDIITNYLYKISQVFHSYYAETKILSSEIKGERIALIKCVDKIILNGLQLLDIEPMDVM